MSGRVCPQCGSGEYGPGLRYEATQTIDVQYCPACGFENPPYGSQTRTIRTYRSIDERACAHCGKRFAVRSTWPTQQYCGRDCVYAASRRRLLARRAS